MTRLMDVARVLRSKNAGAFVLTIDIVFDDEETYRRAVGSDALQPARIAAAYRLPPGEVSVIPYPEVWSVKVTMPRHTGSGDVGDADVYGAQQHVPLMLMDLEAGAGG